MQFDPKSGSVIYAGKDVDDLILIGFVEPDYIQAAKDLAKAELASRGVKVTAEDIERARLLREERRRTEVELLARDFESEEVMPAWRRSLRARLAPYRVAFGLIVLALSALVLLNNVLGWKVLGISGRKLEAFVLLLGMIFISLFVPSKEEVRRQSEERARAA